ncbi:MAG TPA: hypothetical protein VGJ09_07285 [Bryobacteraceae bacterium]|jgi:hypothetical protein
MLATAKLDSNTKATAPPPLFKPQVPSPALTRCPPCTRGEAVLGKLEMLLVAVGIILCVLFPTLLMLPILAAMGFILVGLAIWSDKIQKKQ